jgi:vacuolar protein sorting-associated protein 13A/C
MNQPQDRVSFLDEFSITLAMDGRKMAQQQLSSIQVNIDPVIFRASYRDINLIMTIVNKAIALSTSSNAGKSPSSVGAADKVTEPPKAATTAKSSKRVLNSQTFSTSASAPQLILTKEEVSAPF